MVKRVKTHHLWIADQKLPAVVSCDQFYCATCRYSLLVQGAVCVSHGTLSVDTDFTVNSLTTVLGKHFMWTATCNFLIATPRLRTLIAHLTLMVWRWSVLVELSARCRVLVPSRWLRSCLGSWTNHWDQASVGQCWNIWQCRSRHDVIFNIKIFQNGKCVKYK